MHVAPHAVASVSALQVGGFAAVVPPH
jgi:hypothetical protein